MEKESVVAGIHRQPCDIPKISIIQAVCRLKGGLFAIDKRARTMWVTLQQPGRADTKTQPARKKATVSQDKIDLVVSEFRTYHDPPYEGKEGGGGFVYPHEPAEVIVTRPKSRKR